MFLTFEAGDTIPGVRVDKANDDCPDFCSQSGANVLYYKFSSTDTHYVYTRGADGSLEFAREVTPTTTDDYTDTGIYD